MTFIVQHIEYPWYLGHGRDTPFVVTQLRADAVPFRDLDTAKRVARQFLHFKAVDTDDTPDAVDSTGCA